MEKILVVIKKIPGFLWQYKFTTLNLLFLYLVCISFHGKHNNQFVFLILSFLFLLIGLSKVNRYVRWSVTVVLSVFITFEAYFGFVIGEHLSFGILDSILHTDVSETKGFLATAVWQIIPLFVSIVLLFFLSQSELGITKIKKRLSFGIVAVYWIVYVPIFSMSRTGWSSDTEKVSMFEFVPLYSLYLNVAKKLPLLYHDAIIYGTYWEQGKAQEEYRNREREMPPYLEVDNNINTPLKVYIVLGESANREHFSLYGYSKPTTPLLDSIAKVNSVFYFYRGISSAPITGLAVPMAFTFATPLDDKPLFRDKNLIELAKDVGYEALWISNQAMIGLGDSDISVFSSVSSSRYYLEIDPFLDVHLVDKMKDLTRKDTKQLFILHQAGSHLGYKGKSDEIDINAIPGDDLVFQYDQTIHHTDRFLALLMRTIQEEGSPYILIAFSDHGEVVGKGHGFINEGLDQFCIPFITMQSGEFPLELLVDKYNAEETGLINNLTVMNIVLELLGYKFPSSEIEKVKNASRYIKHVDHEVWRYSNLQNDIKNKSK